MYQGAHDMVTHGLQKKGLQPWGGVGGLWIEARTPPPAASPGLPERADSRTQVARLREQEDGKTCGRKKEPDAVWTLAEGGWATLTDRKGPDIAL